jgi:hypothetical protein
VLDQIKRDSQTFAMDFKLTNCIDGNLDNGKKSQEDFKITQHYNDGNLQESRKINMEMKCTQSNDGKLNDNKMLSADLKHSSNDKSSLLRDRKYFTQDLKLVDNVDANSRNVKALNAYRTPHIDANLDERTKVNRAIIGKDVNYHGDMVRLQSDTIKPAETDRIKTNLSEIEISRLQSIVATMSLPRRKIENETGNFKGNVAEATVAMTLPRNKLNGFVSRDYSTASLGRRKKDEGIANASVTTLQQTGNTKSHGNPVGYEQKLKR